MENGKGDTGRQKKILLLLFWFAVVLLPLVACVVAVFDIPDVAEVPVHWTVLGVPDRWGPPGEMAKAFWIIGATCSSVNIIWALLAALNEQACDIASVRKPDRKKFLWAYRALAAAFAVAAVGLYVWQVLAVARVV